MPTIYPPMRVGGVGDWSIAIEWQDCTWGVPKRRRFTRGTRTPGRSHPHFLFFWRSDFPRHNQDAQGVPPKSVHNAVRFLADALLVQEVFPMEANAKRQSHSPKLCLCDHYVREAWLQEKLPFSISALATAREEICTAAGHLIESDIGYYLKGIPGLNVSWFPKRGDEPEVDFVLTIGERRIPIEVKYRRGAVKPEHLKGLQSFCGQGKYNAPFGLLITQDTAGIVAENIIALPAYGLLSMR